MTYPNLLRPTATETLLLPNGLSVSIPKVELLLRPWVGPLIADTYNGKPLLDVTGRPLFAELAVYELLRLSGWEARWVETYGAPAANPRCYTTWRPDLTAAERRQQPHQLAADCPLPPALAQVAAANGHSYAGCWDVLGWHRETVIFAELKRRKKDRLQATQPRWLAAGLQAGLSPENFLLVEWDFLPGA